MIGISNFLLISLLSKSNTFNNQTYVIGIWAGKETINTRVKFQANSWMHFWNEVLVFSDKFPASSCEKLNKLAYPCNVVCINLGDYSHHLEGTEWTHRWYFAQPRLLPAMAKSYEYNPDADFYLFGDDDTFFMKPAIINKFGHHNSSIPFASGKIYCSWDRVSENIQPIRSCHPFLQGGAGVLLSNGLLSQVASELPNCSKRFNDPDFAGSMRFAICMERLVGISNWSEGAYIKSWSSGFHASQPQIEISMGTVTEASATFHRMNYSDFQWISPKIYVDWTSKLCPIYKQPSYGMILNQSSKKNKYRADLSLYALVQYSLPILTDSYQIVWRIGMWIIPQFGPDEGKKILPKGKWKAVLKNEGIVEGFEQTYENGFRMRLIGDPNLKPGVILPRDISGKDDTFVYAIYPPEIRPL